MAEIEGPWQVSFDPKWGGPEQVTFENLDDWTKRPEEASVLFRHGHLPEAFNLPQAVTQNPRSRMYLDLGTVKNVARVRLNGRDLGVVWTAPWHVEITGAVRPGVNDLEIEVANLWPNRLIGDAALPKEKRLTMTNVQTYDKSRTMVGSPKSAVLLPSGLLGP